MSIITFVVFVLWVTVSILKTTCQFEGTVCEVYMNNIRTKEM